MSLICQLPKKRLQSSRRSNYRSKISLIWMRWICPQIDLRMVRSKLPGAHSCRIDTASLSSSLASLEHIMSYFGQGSFPLHLHPIMISRTQASDIFLALKVSPTWLPVCSSHTLANIVLENFNLWLQCLEWALASLWWVPHWCSISQTNFGLLFSVFHSWEFSKFSYLSLSSQKWLKDFRLTLISSREKMKQLITSLMTKSTMLTDSSLLLLILFHLFLVLMFKLHSEIKSVLTSLAVLASDLESSFSSSIVVHSFSARIGNSWQSCRLSKLQKRNQITSTNKCPHLARIDLSLSA